MLCIVYIHKSVKSAAANVTRQKATFGLNGSENELSFLEVSTSSLSPFYFSYKIFVANVMITLSTAKCCTKMRKE